jgi:hypothetical protein
MYGEEAMGAHGYAMGYDCPGAETDPALACLRTQVQGVVAV